MQLDGFLTQSLFEFGQTMPKNIVVFLSIWLIWLEIIGLALYSLFAFRKKAANFLLPALLSAFFSKAINTLIGFIYFRHRPFVQWGVDALIEKNPFDKSFPSDHAAITWAVAVWVFLHNKKIGLLFLLAALLASIGRVLAGVHFVSDIVAGSLIGIATVILSKKILSDRGKRAK